MPISDELQQLAALHQRGALSDDEFVRAKARVLSGEACVRHAGPAHGLNALRRSTQDRWLGGVCAGLGELTGIAAWLWRLGFVLMVFCAGSGLLAYGLLWLLVPPADGLSGSSAQGPVRSG